MQNKISVDDSFKSYYVVWKLPSFIFPSNPMISFKSYYVVWKPAANNEEASDRVSSLNRTM